MEEKEVLKELEELEEISDEDLTDDNLVSSFSGEVLDAAKAYLLSIGQYKLLPFKETYELFKKYEKTHDPEIKKKLTEHNLRLVVSVVNRHGRPNSSMDFLDLVQEGNLGLMKAVDKYDPDLGYKFSTYATWWIRQAITRSQENDSSTIRIPVQLRNRYYKYKKYKNNYLKMNGYYPTKEDVIEDLNLKKGQYEVLIHIENNIEKTASLNTTVSDDSDSDELEAFVADKKPDAYNDSVNRINDLGLMYNLKQSLSKEFYYVLYYRVLNPEDDTLESIALRLGITRERVRQMEKTAIGKAKLIMKKPRSLSKNLTLKDVLPESSENHAILAYLKKHLEPHEYYIFYNKWVLHENLHNLFSHSVANTAYEIYKRILSEYKDLLSHEPEVYRNAIKEVLETKDTGIIFNVDISPLEYSKVYLMLEHIDVNTLMEILKEVELDDDKTIFEFFDTSFKTIHPSDVEVSFQKLNVHHYDYNYKKTNIPLNKLYKTYLDNKSEFTDAIQEKLEGTIFSCFTNKRFEKNDERLRPRIDYSIYRLESMYYNIDNYYKYELTEHALLTVLNNKKNDLSDEARKLLRKRYIDGITIKELSEAYGVTYIKMHDDIRNYYDHAITLYLNKSNKLKITDEERYKEYILNPKYPMSSMAREVCHLFFIEHKTYKEIATLLNIENTSKVSNFITETVRKMDFWYYGITYEYVFPDDLIYANLNSRNYTEITKKIVIDRFIYGLSNEESAAKLGVDLSKVKATISRFIVEYNEFHSRIKLTRDDLLNELKLPLCDSVLSYEEREFLSFFYGIKNEYNPDGEKYDEEKLLSIIKNPYIFIYDYKRLVLNKIREHKCGLLIPDFSVYSREEVRELLKDPMLPISDYEKELLRAIKGLDGKYYTLSELSSIYGFNAPSIKRRINRALLSIKKYENGEIEGKLDFETQIEPLLKYFPLFDQNIIVKRFKYKKTCKQIGATYKLTKQQSLDLVGRIEKRLFYLLNFPDAKKFDFDYARKVMHNDDIPFYGDKDKAIKLYNRLFGDDGDFPETRADLQKELNFSVHINTAFYIKSLMLAVLKYKDGIKKNKTYTKEEIEDFYNHNKDRYSESDKQAFERTLKKFEENIALPLNDVYNEFVTYEILKEREGPLFYNASTSRDIIKQIFLNNPYGMTHSTLELLRNYFKITKRELMSGKDKNKLIKSLYPILVEYDIKKKKSEKSTVIEEIKLARLLDKEGVRIKEDVDNNVKYILPELLFSRYESSKVLISTDDLDYVFAYIHNYVKDIDVLKRNELLEKLYELKSYIISHSDRFIYKDIFKNGLTTKNMKVLKGMPPELWNFYAELVRSSSDIVRQDINETDPIYIRKTLMPNERYFRRVGIRMRDAKVNFINSINDYYREINLGKITKEKYEELTSRIIDAYLYYIVDGGSLLSYFDNKDVELIEELFANVPHEVTDIRGISFDATPVGKLVRVRKE